MKNLRFQREEVVDFFREQFKSQAQAVMAEGAVLDLVRRGLISSGKAAELLGVSRWEMPELLVKHKIPVIDMGPDELRKHLAEGKEIFRRLREEPA